MTSVPDKARTKHQHKSSDVSLIKHCLQGSEAAWSELITKYKNLIFSIPLRYGLSAEDSADIFQAVCMDLLAGLPHLRDPQALAGWLIQVTRNKCFRRKLSMRSSLEEIGDLDPPASSDEPESVALRLQQEQFLQKALVQLPGQCRELVRMLFFETPPRPYNEIAKELQMARGSVGFLRRTCLDKLRDHLEELC